MRSDHPALRVVRIFLGVVFIAYGTVKLFGGQFVYDEWTITRSTANGPSLVWAFYGFSPVYARFVSLCELIPGIMLLIPRMSFLGAAALFPVALNITVMDFAYDFPGVKYMALLYTLLLALLVWVEREKVFLFLQPIHRVRAILASADSLAMPDPIAPSMNRTVQRVLRGVAVLFVLYVANVVVEGSTEGPERKARQAAIAATGRSDLVLRRSRLLGLSAIGRTGRVEFAAAGDSQVVATAYASRLMGFVPWAIDSVTRAKP
jgi:uncharacterized membrane protein YphA (DoxX/SURF4 family)